VTGGASAIYGSDAIAGAINFILNTEFEGISIDVYQDVYGEGDGKVSDINLTLGRNFANGRGNISGFIGIQDRDAVLHPDRAISEQPLRDDGDNGIVNGGTYSNPGGTGFFPPADLPGFGVTGTYTFLADGTAKPFIEPDDFYNFAQDSYLQIPLSRKIAGLFGHYDISDETRVSMEVSWSDSEVDLQLAPSPFFGFIAQNIDHPSLTPYQQDLLANNFDRGDGIAQIFLLRRLEELGPRQFQIESDSWRNAFVIEGKGPRNFDWEAAYIYSKTDITQTLRNGTLISRISQGLLADPATGQCFDSSNGCVPLSLLGVGSLTANAVDYLRANDVFNSSDIKEQIASVMLSGELVESLDLQTAFGLEWRKQSGDYSSSDALKSNDLAGFRASNDVGGSFSVWEAYAEFVMPVLEDLPLAELVNLEWGVRYSDYSESDSTFTWKAGIDWQINSWLRMRAMVERAIRAPNITELTQTPTVEDNPFGLADNDLCSAQFDPIGNGLTQVCIATGIPADQVGIFQATESFPNIFVYGAGNTDLESESADTTTIGFVITPEFEHDFSIAVDYFEIELEDAITELDDPLQLCFELKDPSSDYCQQFSRGAGLNIVEVNSPFFNQAIKIKFAGFYNQIMNATGIASRYHAKFAC